MKDKFIYETKFTDDVCDGIIDFYNTSDQFQKHPGQISNREDTTKSDKDSIDLSIPWHFIEFDQRLDAYFNFLHQSFVSYFQKFEQARLPCKISDVLTYSGILKAVDIRSGTLRELITNMRSVDTLYG